MAYTVPPAQTEALDAFNLFYETLPKYRKLLRRHNIRFVKSRKWNTYVFILPNGMEYETFNVFIMSEQTHKDFHMLRNLHDVDDNIGALRESLYNLSFKAREYYKLPSTYALRPKCYYQCIV